MITLFNNLRAQEIVFNFENADFQKPIVNADYIFCSNFYWSITNTLLDFSPVQSSAGSYFVNEPYAQETGEWNKKSLETAKYFYFRINANSFNVNRFKCKLYSTGAGPSSVTITINDNVVYNANLGSSTLYEFDFPITTAKNLSEAIVKIIGWDNESRETSGSGILKIDDIEIFTSENIIPAEENQTIIGAVSDTIHNKIITLSDIGSEVVLSEFYLKDNPEDGKFTSITSFSLLKEGFKNVIYFVDYKVYLDDVLLNCSVDNELDKLNFNFSINPLIVDLGDSAVVKITGVFNEQNFIDDDVLYLKYPSHVNLVSSENSSDIIDDLDSDIISNRLIFNVIADRFKVINYPQFVGLATPFSISISATDLYNNIDTNYSGEIKIETETGAGFVSSDWFLENTITGFELKNLIASSCGFHTFLISPENGNIVLTEPIFIGDNNSTIQIENLNNNITVTSDVFLHGYVDVIHFKISDIQETDTLSTNLKSLVFYSNINDLDLREIIDDVKVVNSKNEVVLSTFSIRKGNLLIEFNKNNCEIPSNGSELFLIKIKVKQAVNDGLLLAFYLSNSLNDNTTYGSGSQFANSINSNIISDTILFDVKADRLIFLNSEAFINPDDSVAVVCCSIDPALNIDKDFTSTIQFNTNNCFAAIGDDYSVSGGVSPQIYVKPTLQNGKMWFSAKSDELISANSNIVAVSDFVSIYMNDNYENNGLSYSNSDWKISEIGSICGSKSLKHNLISDYGESNIVLSDKIVKLNYGNLCWQLDIKTGDWSADRDNCWFFELANIDEAKIIVGVNYTGIDDYVSMWFVNNNGDVKKLFSSDYKWQKSETVKLKILYNRNGLWQLFCDNQNDFKPECFLGETKVELINEISYAKINFRFTDKSAGQFWIDNVRFTSYDLPAEIISINHNSTDIVIGFNETIDTSVFSNQNILINSEAYIKQFNYEWNKQLTQISIPWDQYSAGEKSVSISYIDSGGNISDSTFVLSKSKKPDFRELSITEIMYIPKAGQREFIEIFNNSDYNIDGRNCFIQVGADTSLLQNSIIEPNSHIVIVSESAVSWAGNYGKCWFSDALPSLSSEGNIIKLVCNNKLIDLTKYNGDLYNNHAEKGFSIERVDYYNNCFDSTNWKQSVDNLGHSACRQNSAYKENKDTESPFVVDYKLVNDNFIEITFSEPIDTTLRSKVISVAEMDFQVVEICYSEDLLSCLMCLSPNLEKGKRYSIDVDSKITDWAGNKITGNKSLNIFLSDIPVEGDIVINEILFNPYPGGVDFVEIYNTSDKIFDVSEIALATLSQLGEPTSLVKFQRNISFIEPKQFVVFCTDFTGVTSFYETSDTSHFIKCSSFPSYSDSKGNVLILNCNSQVIDKVGYSDSMHFSFLDKTEGVSLERVNPHLLSSDVNNWQSAAQSVGFATPGLANSHYNESATVINDILFSLVNNRFSPDNDGYEDRLIMSYNVQSSDWRLTADVYNNRGVLLARIFDGMTLANNGNLYWDGQLEDSSRIKSGVYFIIFSLYNPQGKLNKFKKAFIVAYPFS